MGLISKGDTLEIYSFEALKKVLPQLKIYKKKYQVLGRGANTLFPEKCKELIIILKFADDNLELDLTQEEFAFSASITLTKIISVAVKYNLLEWDKIAGIPATLGGAIATNAGTIRGDISELISEITIMDIEGNIKIIKNKKGCFSYRKNHFLVYGDVVIGAKLINFGSNPAVSKKISDYLTVRKSSQPIDKRSSGCIFKNYVGSTTCRAGKYIDIMGMKGFKLGGLSVSIKHANFIENSGGATLDDFLKINRYLQEELEQHFGIRFENEVVI
jgi:UDP-N-acetylmuramate dehydrogenase